MIDSRLSLLTRRSAPSLFELTRFVDGLAAPLDLHGTSLRLFVRQIVQVVDGHCRTESYAYRFQADGSIGSWLIRWEYLRSPPRPSYAYTAAHVHVNGSWQRSEMLDRLHIPTQQVPLELVVWHLIAEWGVSPKTDDWQAILRESIRASAAE